MAVAAKRRYTAYDGVVCPHCSQRLRSEHLFTGEGSCPSCKKFFIGAAFQPVVRKKANVARVIETGPQGSAVCAKHERNAAVANCERCGNFMCGLCRIDTDGMTLCPACFERLASEGALPSALKSFRDYSALSSSIVVLGMLVMIFGVFTGPPALYFAYKGYKQKQELQETEGRWALLLVVLLAVLQMAVSVLWIWAVFFSFGRMR